MLLPTELIIMIFNFLPNQKSQYNLGLTNRFFQKIYTTLIINNPKLYKFYETKPTVFQMIDPIVYEFKRITKNTVEFDKKYQRCDKCKRRRICCDRNEIC